MRDWFHNVWIAIRTVAAGLAVTMRMWLRTYRRRTATEVYEYPEVPVPVKARYRGFHRFDLTSCIGCDRCADACPVDCIFMGSTYDLSCYSRDGCLVDFAKLPLDIAWGRATLNPTAVAASKVVTEPVWIKGEPVPPGNLGNNADKSPKMDAGAKPARVSA
jgi:NADH-quinone oxidoreductase subunit I